MPRSARLRASRDFQDAYRQQRRVVGRYMVLFRRAAPDAALRLGVVASRRVGNAVARARAKRRLREAFRRQRAGLQGQDDVVLVARQTILAASWEAVQDDLTHVLRRAAFLPRNNRAVPDRRETPETTADRHT